MTTHNANNEQIKRRYLSFLKEAKRQSEPSLSFDGVGDYLQAPDSAGYDNISTEMMVCMAGKVLPSTLIREIINTSFTNNTWRWRVLANEKLELLVNDGGLERPAGATSVTENQSIQYFDHQFCGRW